MSSQLRRSPGRPIFLDRDGVINENRADHVKSWQEFRFLPGAIDALRLLTQQSFAVYIVTNQAAINRRLTSHAAVEEIHRRRAAVASSHGAQIAGVRYCPHRDEERCDCRKPRPGMLLSLASEHQFDPSQASLVGDALSDIAAGQQVGCRTILVRTGRGREQLARLDASQHRPDHIADSLIDAVLWLMAQPPHGEAAPRERALGEWRAGAWAGPQFDQPRAL